MSSTKTLKPKKSIIMKQGKNWLSLLLFTMVFISCKKSEVNSKSLHLNITGLEDLGANFKYEGWLLINGSPITTGTFTVNASGVLSQTSFDIDKNQLAAATDFVLTIEPFPDANPAPTDTHILSGAFSAGSANITINDAKALGTNFSTATGKYILGTPTNGNANNEKSGIWFLDLSAGSPMKGLTLPTLPAGWAYEGWAVIGGKPVTTGRFLNPVLPDLAAPFSGTTAGAPPFPGEDFIMNAPDGFTFPTDLSSGLAVISVEPVPDNSPAPFLLKPLISNIPVAALDHVTYSMTVSTATLPSGTITR